MTLISKDNWGKIVYCVDWFHANNSCQCFVWAPALAAANVAVDQLGKKIHKHLNEMPIFISPWLMTAHWRKQLGKVCDVVLTIPVGTWF